MVGSSVRIGDRGRFVLPAEVRAAAGLAVGEVVGVRVLGEGRVVLESLPAIRERIRAMVPPGTRGVVDELLAERRAAALEEDAELRGGGG